MRRTMTRVLLLASILIAAILGGCGGGEQYGEAISPGEATKISDILADPGQYEGKTVKLAGTIVTECPSGCWFEMSDGSAIVYVDIAPRGLAIPQHVGSDVTVEGTVTTVDKQTKIFGEGVEIR